MNVHPAAIISPWQILLREWIYRTVCQCWGILPLQSNPKQQKRAQSNNHHNSHEQECSYILAPNNNKPQGRLLRYSTTSGAPLRMHLVEVDGNRAQIGTPHEMSLSERTPSGNSLTSADNPLGMNLLNSSPMLGNPTSIKQPETAKNRTQSNTHRNRHEQECSYSSAPNNNTTQGRL